MQQQSLLKRIKEDLERQISDLNDQLRGKASDEDFKALEQERDALIQKRDDLEGQISELNNQLETANQSLAKL